MRLDVIIHKAEEGGYWAEVPVLPGCVTQAETMKELRSNANDAISGWLKAHKAMELNEPVEIYYRGKKKGARTHTSDKIVR